MLSQLALIISSSLRTFAPVFPEQPGFTKKTIKIKKKRRKKKELTQTLKSSQQLDINRNFKLKVAIDEKIVTEPRFLRNLLRHE